ncbi:hypothetical protein JCM10207_006399 [Rhodosporidiobolus poonsookiae]
MLDRLPSELVDAILRFALQGPNDFKQRSCNQQWIARLCNVSTAVCKSAQSLLYKDVLLQRRQQTDSLMQTLQAKVDLAQHIRMLRVRAVDRRDYREEVSLYVEEAFTLLPLLPNLRGLCLAKIRDEELSWTDLYRIPRLESLVLDSVEVEDVPPDFVLPHLTSLTISDDRTLPWENGEVTALLTPAHLPSLRALSVDFEVSPAIASFAQLEMFQMLVDDALACEGWDDEHPPLRLNVFTIDLHKSDDLSRALQQLPPSHWRVVTSMKRSYSTNAKQDLHTLSSFLASTSTLPLSIHLPRDLYRAGVEGFKPYRDGVERLLRVLEERRLEVRWHDEPLEDEDKHLVSESCWRYVRELKSKEE